MLLCALLGSTAARAQEGAPADTRRDVRVRAEVHASFSPFERVTWEWKRVGRAPAVAVTRFHVGGFDAVGADTAVELVSAPAYAALVAELDACVAEHLGEPTTGATPTDGATLTIDEGAERTWTIGAGGADHPCVALVRDAVLRWVVLDRYTHPYWDEGEYGALRSASNLPASVRVDGRFTGLITPVSEHRIEPGVRRVTWTALATGEVFEREVTIRAGTTTTVDVTFDDGTGAPD